MKRTSARISLCIFFSLLLLSTVSAQVNVSDSLALVDLYNSTDGAHWVNNQNWLTRSPVKNWAGIEVRHNRVVLIGLDYNGLNGTLPLSLGNLDSLIRFEIFYNSLHGSFPATLANITALRRINLGFNQLSGSIPDSIGKLPYLIELNLQNNLIEGSIPTSVGRCKHLQFLMLNNNQLTGHLPPSIGRLKKLKFLDVSYNQLSGSLPDNFETGSLLYEFDITSNQFSGTIPVSLSNLSELQYLDLPSNQLSGTIPPGLANLSKLIRLSLANNQLTGSLPASFKKFTRLGYLNVSNNNLRQNDFIPLDGNRYYFTCYMEENNFNFNLPEYLIQEDISVYCWPQANIAIHPFNGKLAVSAGGTLQNNTYTWRRTGSKEKWILAGDSVFQPPVNGRYYAQITNAIATHLTLYTDTVNYTFPLIKNNLVIAVYPNPARDMIEIHGWGDKEDISVSITDMNGYVWARAMSHQQAEMKIDVSRLKSGNYLVNVAKGKEVKTIQFVKE